MILNCLIIDDEPLAHDVIIKYISDIPFLELVGQAYEPVTGLKLINEMQVDLLFLDIKMPKIQGLDFLRILKFRPLVIITSAYEEYALESYELEVCDYLLKPFRFDRFLKASTKALDLHVLKHKPISPAPFIEPFPTTLSKPAQLFIKSDKRLIHVDVKEIYFFESYGNYVKVWKQHEYILTPQTLILIESQLSGTDFIRIHKSYIVNKQLISYVEGNMVVLQGGKVLPLGKNHRQIFKDSSW